MMLVLLMVSVLPFTEGPLCLRLADACHQIGEVLDREDVPYSRKKQARRDFGACVSEYEGACGRWW